MNFIDIEYNASRFVMHLLQQHCSLVEFLIIIAIMQELSYNETRADSDDDLCPKYDNFKSELTVLYKPKWEYFPNNIDESLSAVHITYPFNLKKVRKQDFSRYQKLLYIFIRLHIDNHTEIEPDAFKNLTLVILALENFNLNNVPFYFPNTLRRLSLINCNVTDKIMNLTPLKYLCGLYLYNNNITRLPVIYQFAPLQDLRIWNNSLKIFSVKQIARFCKMQVLLIDPDSLNNDFCECQRSRAWMKKRNIENVWANNCSNEELCEEPLITNRMNELYKNCINNKKVKLKDDFDYGKLRKKEKKKKMNIPPWIFLLIIIGVIMAIFGLYMRRNRRKIEIVRKIASPNNSAEVPLPSKEPEIKQTKEHTTDELTKNK